MLVQWAERRTGPVAASRRRRRGTRRPISASWHPWPASMMPREAYIGRLAELVARRRRSPDLRGQRATTRRWRASRAQWPGAPILFGNDSTFNPKMNNVRKGLEAASRPVVALCDAGIALTAGELVAAAAQLSDEVGLVLALKAGEQPENFAAEMECAYINGHQARFLLAADRLGMPVASGGVTHPHPGRPASASAVIRASSTISPTIIPSCARCATASDGRRGSPTSCRRLPLGRRRWSDVWRRQVRWGSTRLNLAYRGEGAGAVGAGDRLARLGTGGERGPDRLRRRSGHPGACPRRAHDCVVRRRSMVRRGLPVCRSDRAPGRRRWCARRWCRCWRPRPGADATESTGAAPTWPPAGGPGMAPPERAYEDDERHGGHCHRHAAGARRIRRPRRRSRR